MVLNWHLRARQSASMDGWGTVKAAPGKYLALRGCLALAWLQVRVYLLSRTPSQAKIILHYYSLAFKLCYDCCLYLPPPPNHRRSTTQPKLARADADRGLYHD